MTLERMAHGLEYWGRAHAKADTRSFWELLTKLYREKVNAIFTSQTGTKRTAIVHGYVRSLANPQRAAFRIRIRHNVPS